MATLSPDPAGRNGPPRDADKVIQFPRLDTVSPFDRVTTNLVLAQYRRGVLQEGVLVALLAGVGTQP